MTNYKYLARFIFIGLAEDIHNKFKHKSDLLEQLLGCPEELPNAYTSRKQMIIDQMLRQVGILDYVEELER